MAPKLILVIEDNEGIRETLRLTLELEGFEVATAANGKLGLETLYGPQKPCLILLDLMMPVMDGWAFAEAMGQDIALATIPIVVVTAVAENAKDVKLARGVIKKPVDMDVLLRTVREYC
jgi:two-component system, chemotaxis family, chemotaxis protein CheY